MLGVLQLNVNITKLFTQCSRLSLVGHARLIAAVCLNEMHDHGDDSQHGQKHYVLVLQQCFPTFAKELDDEGIAKDTGGEPARDVQQNSKKCHTLIHSLYLSSLKFANHIVDDVKMIFEKYFFHILEDVKRNPTSFLCVVISLNFVEWAGS